VRTSAKIRLTWSLAILLALAAIATSVSYVASTHLAEAQAQDTTTHRLRQVARITGPNIPPRGLWAFDIGFVDDQSQVYYLADASNASVDMIDTRTNTLIGQIGGFRGFHGSRETQGPGGVLVDDLGQLWASDGDSTVKVIDLLSRTIVATLHTGGAKRAASTCGSQPGGINRAAHRTRGIAWSARVRGGSASGSTARRFDSATARSL